MYSDETMQADDKAFFMKVQDIVKTAVDEARFNLCVDKLKASRKEFTGDDPVQTVEVLGDKYLLNKNERAAIMRHFIMGSDVSSYGLINAVTRASQDVEDYNRATDLERIGGELLAGTKLATVEALPYIETTAVEVPVRSKVLRISDSKRR